jgi:hypothetical protein
MNEYEDILKGLDRAQQTARRGSLGATMLEDKLRMQRLRNTIVTCRRELLKLYHDYEDATRFAELIEDEEE